MDKIIISNPKNNNWFPRFDWYNENQAVELDTDDDFAFVHNRRLFAESVTNIASETVYGFRLPKTEKNVYFLDKYLQAQILDFDVSKTLDVAAFTASRPIPQTQLNVLGDDGTHYDCELRHAKTALLEILSNEKLNVGNLGLGIDYQANTILNWRATANYTGADDVDLVRFPLAFYGAFYDTLNGVSLADLRPLVSAYGIVKRWICNAGYELESPLLQSLDFSRVWAYILDKDFGTDVSAAESRAVSAFRATNLGLLNNAPNNVTWDAPTDPYSNLQANGRYIGAGQINVKARFMLEWKGVGVSVFNSNIRSFKINCHLVYNSPRTGDIRIKTQFVDIDGTQYDENGTYGTELFFNVQNIELPLGANLRFVVEATQEQGRTPCEFIRIRATAPDPPNAPQRTFATFTASRVYINEGDTFNLERLLDKEKLKIDFIKGVNHACNLRFIVDEAQKKVYWFPTHASSFWNGTIEGWFAETVPKDVTDTVELNSVKRSVNRNGKRYAQFKWANDGDGKIGNLKLAKETPFGGHLEDYGTIGNSETEVYENPFFEATVSETFLEWSTNRVPLHLPCMVESSFDAQNSRFAFDIAPRLLYLNDGAKYHRIAESSVPFFQQAVYKRDGNDATSYLTAYNVPTFYDGMGVNEQPKEYFSYGVQGVGVPSPKWIKSNLWTIAWRKYLFQITNNVKFNLKQFVRLTDVFRYDLTRNWYAMHVDGKPLRFRLSEISFSLNDTTHDVTYYPERDSVDFCDTISKSVGQVGNFDCAQNAPQLIIARDTAGGQYTFSVGGQTASTIATVQFYAREVNDTLGFGWQPTISRPTNKPSFDVRMVVTYVGGCPPSERRQRVNTCADGLQQNNENVQIYVDFAAQTAIFEPINFDATANTYTAQIRFMVGGAFQNWEIYTGTPINIPFSATVYEVEATFDYMDCSRSVSFSDTLIGAFDCAQVAATVTCNATGDGFARAGYVTDNVALDVIEYRTAGSSDNWRTWNEVETVNVAKNEYRRVVVFCGDICPTYCSAVVVGCP